MFIFSFDFCRERRANIGIFSVLHCRRGLFSGIGAAGQGFGAVCRRFRTARPRCRTPRGHCLGGQVRRPEKTSATTEFPIVVLGISIAATGNTHRYAGRTGRKGAFVKPCDGNVGRSRGRYAEKSYLCGRYVDVDFDFDGPGVRARVDASPAQAVARRADRSAGMAAAFPAGRRGRSERRPRGGPAATGWLGRSAGPGDSDGQRCDGLVADPLGRDEERGRPCAVA